MKHFGERVSVKVVGKSSLEAADCYFKFVKHRDVHRSGI